MHPKDRARIHHSGDFHVLLAQECGNGEIKSLIRRLVARTSLITELFGNDRALECWHEEHVRLLDMLAVGTTAAATKLMLMQLQSIEDELRLNPTYGYRTRPSKSAFAPEMTAK